MSFLNFILLPAISGLLTQISLAPAHIYPVAFVALIPFFISLKKIKSLKGKVLTGLLTGFFANLFGFYWMVLVFKNFFLYTLHESIGLFFLYCFVGHLQFVLFAISFHFLNKFKSLKVNDDSNYGFNVIVFALTYALVDFMTPKLFGDTLGNAFDNQIQLRQLSKFLGLIFLTFICSLVNYSLVEDIRLKKIKYSLFSVIFVLICGLFGNIENEKQINLVNSSKQSISVAVIQPNTLGKIKVQAEHGNLDTKQNNARDLLSMSKEALSRDKNIDLIIWPETAYPAFYTNPLNKVDIQINNDLNSFVLKSHVAILFGLTDRDNDGKRYNSAILIQEEDQSIKFEVYHKVILAFMGEYNPFAKKTAGALQVGENPVLLTLKTKDKKKIKISPIICYEALSPLYISKAKKLNPDLLVHISNESWFGYFGIPQSFLALSAFRAIESEVPMIKAANSGFSALVMPNGDINMLSHLNEKEIVIMNVPIIQK